MKRPRKSQRTEEKSSAAADVVESSSSESDDSSSSSEEDLVDRVADGKVDNINIEFDTRDPAEKDWHSIKRAVAGIFDRGDIAEFDAGALADVIIEQSEYVGSVLQAEQNLKTEDDKQQQQQQQQQQQTSPPKKEKSAKRKRGDNAYDAAADVDPQLVGVLSLVNWRDRRDTTFVKQAEEMLVAKLKKKASKERKRGGSPVEGETSAVAALDQVRTLFGEDSALRLGWWISERLLNVPPEIAPPLCDSLVREVGWAIEHAAPEKSPFDVDMYLKVVVTNSTDQDKSPMFVHDEDEIWFQHATVKVSWPLEAGESGRWTLENPNVTSRRWLLLMPAGKITDVLAEMVKTLSPTEGSLVQTGWD